MNRLESPGFSRGEDVKTTSTQDDDDWRAIRSIGPTRDVYIAALCAVRSRAGR